MVLNFPLNVGNVFFAMLDDHLINTFHVYYILIAILVLACYMYCVSLYHTLIHNLADYCMSFLLGDYIITFCLWIQVFIIYYIYNIIHSIIFEEIEPDAINLTIF